MTRHSLRMAAASAALVTACSFSERNFVAMDAAADVANDLGAEVLVDAMEVTADAAPGADATPDVATDKSFIDVTQDDAPVDVVPDVAPPDVIDASTDALGDDVADVTMDEPQDALADTATDGCADVPCPTRVVEVAAGQYHTCVRMSDGTVRCWGDNTWGQLATDPGVTLSRRAPSDATRVPGVSDAVQIATGSKHSCVLLRGGALRCWGRDDSQQLGDGAVVADAGTVVEVSGLSNVAQVAAGASNTCARRGDGQVFCWGANDLGEVGVTSTGSADVRSIPTLTSVTASQVAVGGGSACAVLQESAGSAVRCWGYNGLGMLGNGVSGMGGPTATDTGLSGAAEVSLGLDHACARLRDGTVQCWGLNDVGQLGDGTLDLQRAPVMVRNGTGALRDVAQIALGNFPRTPDSFSCARTTVGAVLCWGGNESGQLGNGTATDGGIATTRPQAVSLPGRAVQITAGGRHACALLDDGAVFCWGANQSYQLGDGSATSRSTPVRVMGL